MVPSNDSLDFRYPYHNIAVGSLSDWVSAKFEISFYQSAEDFDESGFLHSYAWCSLVLSFRFFLLSGIEEIFVRLVIWAMLWLLLNQKSREHQSFGNEWPWVETEKLYEASTSKCPRHARIVQRIYFPSERNMWKLFSELASNGLKWNDWNGWSKLAVSPHAKAFSEAGSSHATNCKWTEFACRSKAIGASF